MTNREKFNLVLVAWLINAVLFVIAWFGGDVLLVTTPYMEDSVEAMRVTLTCTKTVLSLLLIVGATELKKED